MAGYRSPSFVPHYLPICKQDRPSLSFTVLSHLNLSHELYVLRSFPPNSLYLEVSKPYGITHRSA